MPDGDLRRDIQELREKMVAFGRDQEHMMGDVRSLIASQSKHEAEDDAKFARHESFLLGENGVFQRLGRQDSDLGVGKWVMRTILGSVLTIAVTLAWALIAGFLKAGAP